MSGIPRPPGFFAPVLQVLAQDPAGLRRRDIYEPVADLLQLSPEQRVERLPSGAHLRYQHRTGWGINMLKNAGYVEATGAGAWRLTAKGRALIENHPSGFDEATMREIVRESRSGVDEPEAESEGEPAATQGTPDERIDLAVVELNSGIARELLNRIAQAPPDFFERLVLDVLHAMGYGQNESDLQHVGRSGDGGIDGIVSLDKLGLEKIFVQAKRWQGAVGRPEVQAFYGALAGRRARKGILFTTSVFTREAREFAEHVSETIALVDGQRLAGLMIEHGVGVTHYRMLELPRVDSDYFLDA